MFANKTEFLTGLKTLIGDNTDDNALAVLEYANKIDSETETKITELTEKINTLTTEKDELDKSWRERYKNAFFAPPVKEDIPADTPNVDENGVPENYPKTYEDLFTETE